MIYFTNALHIAFFKNCFVGRVLFVKFLGKKHIVEYSLRLIITMYVVNWNYDGNNVAHLYYS